MITIRQLQALYWVAKLQSYRDAAEILHLSQSALSKRLAELETILGKAIIDRSGYRFGLTQFGSVLIRRIGPFLQSYEELCRFGTDSIELEGHVSFGLVELVTLTWLPNAIASLRSQFPRIVLEPHVSRSPELIQRVKTGATNFAVVTVKDFDDDLEFTKAADVDYSLLISPKLLNPEMGFRREDVVRYPVLTQSPESKPVQVFDAWAVGHEISVQKVLATNSLTAVLRMVLMGLGAGFLPLGLCAPLIRDQRLIKVEDTPHALIGYYFVKRKAAFDELNAAVHRIMSATCDFSVSTYTELTS